MTPTTSNPPRESAAVHVHVKLDLEEMSWLMSGEQVLATLNGIGAVLAAAQSEPTEPQPGGPA